MATVWIDEMTPLLRCIIDDFGDPPKYSDDRLSQLLVVAAQFVQNENPFPIKYNINVQNITITPDPTNISQTQELSCSHFTFDSSGVATDNSFINLTVLKSACLLASSGLLKASAESLNVKEGPYQFDGRNKLEGRKAVAQTWCQAYKDAQWEHVTQHAEPGRTILGPYRLIMYGAGYGLGRDLIGRGGGYYDQRLL